MLAELATVKAVASPHVVRTFEAFMVQLDGMLTFFLTLELCDGGDLSAYLKKRQVADELEAARLLTHLLVALKYLHGRMAPPACQK